jgi:hypothetical protein
MALKQVSACSEVQRPTSRTGGRIWYISSASAGKGRCNDSY